jgi:ribose 5-phosphate isomerase B
MITKTIAIGFDHAGFELAHALEGWLSQDGHSVVLVGPTDKLDSVDYPPFCIEAASKVSEQAADFGIVLGGSGQGEQIAANKVWGIRAALCTEPYYAMLARRDNDANVLALPARLITFEYAAVILRAWLETPFEGGRHARRMKLIADYESQHRVPINQPGEKR